MRIYVKPVKRPRRVPAGYEDINSPEIMLGTVIVGLLASVMIAAFIWWVRTR